VSTPRDREERGYVRQRRARLQNSPMDVVLPVDRQVVVDDQRDLLNVDTSGQQVCGDENSALLLVHVSVLQYIHIEVSIIECVEVSTIESVDCRGKYFTRKGREREEGETPTMVNTVKSFCCIFSVSQSTFLLVLQKMTAWVMVRVS